MNQVKRASRMDSQQRAFTLNELLVSLMIVGILATIAVPYARDALLRAQIAETQNNLRVLAQAVELFAVDQGHYPYGSNEPPTDFFTNYDAQIALSPLLGIYLPDDEALLQDPFTEKAAHLINDSIALGNDLIPEAFGYGYYDYAHFMAPPREPIRGYGLISFGPDGEDSRLGLKPLSGMGALITGACYHPSNGLSSQGDMGRFGGDFAFPQQIP